MISTEMPGMSSDQSAATESSTAWAEEQVRQLLEVQARQSRMNLTLATIGLSVNSILILFVGCLVAAQLFITVPMFSMIGPLSGDSTPTTGQSQHSAKSTQSKPSTDSAGDALAPFGTITPSLETALVAVGAVTAAWMAATIAAAVCVFRKRRKTFAIVMSGISCLLFPVGTLIGALCTWALLQPSVQDQFS